MTIFSLFLYFSLSLSLYMLMKKNVQFNESKRAVTYILKTFYFYAYVYFYANFLFTENKILVTYEIFLFTFMCSLYMNFNKHRHTLKILNISFRRKP